MERTCKKCFELYAFAKNRQNFVRTGFIVIQSDRKILPDSFICTRLLQFPIEMRVNLYKCTSCNSFIMILPKTSRVQKILSSVKSANIFRTLCIVVTKKLCIKVTTTTYLCIYERIRRLWPVTDIGGWPLVKESSRNKKNRSPSPWKI